MNKIVFCCNNECFDGLYLSVLSILRRTKIDIAFYALSGDCSDINPHYNVVDEIHIDALNNLVKSFNLNNSFTLIDGTEIYNQYLKGNKSEKSRYTPYTCFRLLLDKINEFQTGKVLYLDLDTMCNGDIKEFFDIDLKDYELAATHDVLGYHPIKKDWFNSGVLFLNMDKIIENKTFEKARKLLFDRKLDLPDQTALNLAINKIMFFPNDDNRFNYMIKGIKEDTIIKHFCRRTFLIFFGINVKQWEIDRVHKTLKIHNFDEDFNFYLNYKENVKKDLKDKYFIKVNHLKKRYDAIKAVDDISFKVKKGSLFAFLGVNGAGKSTTINIISSTLEKDSGEVIIDGFDLDMDRLQIKKEIGIVFQNSTLDNILTVEENLKIRAKFYKMKKDEIVKSIERVTKMLDLAPILKQQIGKLSGGQKRRVDIARALIHEPKLLMLDEPTTGLDPKTRIDVWKLIDEIRLRTNMTVFLTTHYLEEAEKATYVVIMNKGKIIADGTPNNLKNRYSSDSLIVYRKRDETFDKKISNYEYDNDAKAYRIFVKDSQEAKDLINKYKDDILDFEIKKGNMDDVFLNVTGLKNEDAK